MTKRTALAAAVIVAATLATGTVAYATSIGIAIGRTDNIGRLQPTLTDPTASGDEDTTGNADAPDDDHEDESDPTQGNDN